MDPIKPLKKRKPTMRVGGASGAVAECTDAAPVDGPATNASLDGKIYLEPSLEIKDVESAHRRLSEALARGVPLTVDTSRVAGADTAGAQLLLAFQIEATKRSVPLEFCGESAALTHALTVLGLLDIVQISSARG
ncbi:MAG: hypothetical protein JWN43_3163 [Gammaproteobacteria bacterium]|nr:hypothetical protein [Gammaproteobacteria bacterium]